MRIFRFVLAMSAVAAPFAAHADEPSRIEKMIATQSKLCFARVYDSAHLAAHPRQKVERLFFMIGKDKAATYWEDPNLRHSEESPHKHANPDADASNRDSIQAAALVTLRGAKKPENVSGWCFKSEFDPKSKASLQCGGECDRHIGGLRAEDDSHLIIDGVGADLLLDPEDEEAGDATSRLGADDKSFRLERRPIEECVAEANKTNSPYAGLGAPLRERLKPDVPFCYGRDYSTQHLASHVQQQTVSVRVWRDAKQIDADRAKKLLPDWPDGASVSASVTTRKNGKPATLKYSCTPFEDQWQCSATFCKTGSEADCAPQDIENAKATGCTTGESRTIYLRRGEKDFVTLGNPNMGLQLEAYCGQEKKTQSDDKVYRLEPMPLSACEGR